MDELINIYQKQINKVTAELSKVKYKSRLVGFTRVLFFLTFIVLLYLFFERGYFILLVLWVFFTLGGFAFLIRYHNHIKHAGELLRIRQEINHEEIDRQKMDLSDFDGGHEFINNDHLYTSDLDIFGKNSLFSLVNRTSTVPGKDQLAHFFKNPLPVNKILNHQDAVKALTPLIEWRQHFQATGLISGANSKDHRRLKKWFENRNQSNLLFQVVKYVLPLPALGFLILFLLYNWTIYPFLAAYILNLYILKQTSKRIQYLYKGTQASVSTLGSVSRQLMMIEELESDSPFLKSLNETLTAEAKASSEIRKLFRILDFMKGRSNLFYIIFNPLFLFDHHLIDLAGRWKERNGLRTREWFNTLGVVDSLCSIAGFSFAHPDFAFPVIVEDSEPILVVKEAGHPLIEKNVRINNDFTLKGTGSLALITGSNMSGKSTFLRTLGVNCVLAQMGAPVCAGEHRMTSMHVFTSMRIVDDLNQKMSSFYAELNRLKKLLDFISQNDTVIYLLDEVLMGTNSHDRHRGSEALIQQLVQTHAIGLIATHDLELGKLEDKDTRIVNFCFTSEIHDGSINFDYKIRKGIGYNFNASELMKKMGINI